jgi:hypothetical protein
MAAIMKWTNASADNPGHSVYYAIPKRDPNTLYVIRQKKKTPDFTPRGWRVFARSAKREKLRTIYMAPKLAEAKAFVKDLEDALIKAGTP